MKRIPIALQLYSVRRDCERDLYGTLEEIAKMGYEGVEFAGYYDRTAEELRRILEDLGLKVVGSHLRIDTLRGDELKKTIEFNRVLGNKYLIVPSLPKEMRESKASWMEAARLMNKISEKVKPEGMQTGYHNHAVDFMPINGEIPWYIFFGEAEPDVIMQLDTGNAMMGGLTADEVIEVIKKYPGRAVTVHLKEFSSTNKKAVIGEGDMKWEEFFKTCETVGGTEWYIVEQESYAYPPLECVKKCLENLKGLL
ncbi:TPA: sugar phosphate isomerase/epimerase [Candidatus Bathyarchaeota archaeon]|nr:sugar phosphate isomerase/epimerase [Candidatus Bathyarchaeota archaeon]